MMSLASHKRGHDLYSAGIIVPAGDSGLTTLFMGPTMATPVQLKRGGCIRICYQFDVRLILLFSHNIIAL